MARTTSRRCIAVSKQFNKKRIALLNALCHADGQQRTALLRTADKKLVHCICECALNILQGVVEIKDAHKRRLRKHESVLRKLTIPARGKKSEEWLKKTSFAPARRCLFTAFTRTNHRSSRLENI